MSGIPLKTDGSIATLSRERGSQSLEGSQAMMECQVARISKLLGKAIVAPDELLISQYYTTIEDNNDDKERALTPCMA